MCFDIAPYSLTLRPVFCHCVLCLALRLVFGIASCVWHCILCFEIKSCALACALTWRPAL